MVETINKQCSRCKKEEGDVTFDLRKKNGKPYCHCDNCTNYRLNISNWNERRKDRYKKKYGLDSNNCVYAFFDKGDLVYIGESDNTGFRLHNQINNKSKTGNSSLKKYNVLQRKQLEWRILWSGEEGDDKTRLEKEKFFIKKYTNNTNLINKTHR